MLNCKRKTREQIDEIIIALELHATAFGKRRGSRAGFMGAHKNAPNRRSRLYASVTISRGSFSTAVANTAIELGSRDDLLRFRGNAAFH
jgi:hypothetical protein